MSGSRWPFSSRPFGWLAASYAAVCVGLWPVPVFGLLHAESSAVVAGVGCLAAAVGGAGALRRGSGLDAVARAHLEALVVPLVLLTASLLWRPNCGYLQGLGLFLVLVPPSVLFGLGVAYAASAPGVRGPRVSAAVAVLAVALGGVVLDLGLHPQLFTYSHVFGGVLGPIYDEELAVRAGLFAAKGQTLLWATALVAFGAARRGAGGRARSVLSVAAVALLASYALAGPLGIVQTERGLERALSQRVDLGPVVLHLDPATPEARGRRLADEALYRFGALADTLGVRPDEPVDVYLYPDPDTKAALIGSRTTSVVPVWLPSPQVHMLEDEVGRSLGHELVHVLAREFGAPIVRASPAIGLVEGLAVALEPPDGLPDPTALVVAGRALGPRAGGVEAPAEAVRATMSPGGFWTSRAGVAYTANGAFVAWLLRRYGAAPLREAYRTGRFDSAYGRGLEALTGAWEGELVSLEVDPEAVAVGRWLFSRPSLFERRCPHHVPAEVRHARAGDRAWEDGDAAEAARQYTQSVIANDQWLPGLRGTVQTALARGRGPGLEALRLARARADSLPDPAALVHLADVRRLRGLEADALYRAAADSLAPVDAVGRLLLRQRAGLEAPALRALLAAPPDAVPRGLEAEAPVLAVLRAAGADRPVEAWAVARGVCPDRVTGGLDGAEAAEAALVLRLIQGQTAYRAGAYRAAARALDGLDAAFAEVGPRSLGPLARDWARRVDWRRGRRGGPAIFDAPATPPDDRPPCLAPRRPADRDGVLAP